MSTPHPLPLQKSSLRNEIFDFLSDQIVIGNYIPGQWLRQDEIATQLGVSQTPVREALDLLVSAGLAERLPYRGVRVIKVSHDELIDIYVLRLVLEIAIVHLAIHNISPEQQQRIHQILEQISELHTLDDISQHRRLNKQFHQTIAEASGNKQLEAQYITASNRFPEWMLYDHIVRNPQRLETVFSKELLEHRAIAEAIASRDSIQALCRTLDHLHGVREDFAHITGIPVDTMKEKESQLGIHQFIQALKIKKNTP